MTTTRLSLDLLVLAAFAPELEAFRGVSGGVGAPEGRVGGLLVDTVAVGIGMVAAASGASSSLDARGPRGVVLVGTCGAYEGSGLAIGAVVVVGASRLVAPEVVRGRAAFPGPMLALVPSDLALAGALAAAGAPLVDVATTLGVTTDDGLAETLGAGGAAVEHLEAFGVATACALRSVPFAAVLGVSNAVGSSGRRQWRDNHLAAGRAACEHVLGWARAGAPGLRGAAPAGE